jgi:N-acetylglucosaminyldiphosphoundecaprenol N-acetyl-beta-D-mannosaminyltransferase
MKGKTFINSKTVKVLNVPFSITSFASILNELDETIKKRRIGGYISITNTESAYHATRIPSHLQYIKNADFSCCDGVGVVLAAKLLGFNIPRLHGPDFMMKCCEYGVERKWRHFFYGGKKGVPELLSGELTKKNHELITVGTFSPPFRALTIEEDKEIIEMVNKADPDILWVGLGLLKQERWITEHLGEIKVPWMVGVGAAFDFNAGTIKRAPKVFRNTGLEWLYRLTFEPRMLIRNFYSFSLFLDIIKEARRRHA